MIRAALAKLRRDRRGGAGIGPVFVIVSVLVILATAAVLTVGGTTASRQAAKYDIDAAARTAASAVAADLSERAATTTPAAALTVVRDLVNSGAYLPTSLNGLYVPGPSVTYSDAVITGDNMEVRLAIAAPRAGVKDVSATVTLTKMTLEFDDAQGRWVAPADAGKPDRDVWAVTKVSR